VDSRLWVCLRPTLNSTRCTHWHIVAHTVVYILMYNIYTLWPKGTVPGLPKVSCLTIILPFRLSSFFNVYNIYSSTHFVQRAEVYSY
jgi:hypothetical protein